MTTYANEKEFRKAFKELADEVWSEWFDFIDDLLDKFDSVTFDLDLDRRALEAITDSVKLEAAEHMRRCTSTWSGEEDYIPNSIELMRRRIADQVFGKAGGMVIQRYFELRKVQDKK